MKMRLARRLVFFGQWLTVVAAKWVGPDRVPELIDSYLRSQSDQAARGAAVFTQRETERRAAERALSQ